MTTQPEALLLAEYHEALAALPPASEKGGHILRTAAELRRLHEENKELLKALRSIMNTVDRHAQLGLEPAENSPVAKARAAIAKAEGG
jgi:hypothetical protein